MAVLTYDGDSIINLCRNSVEYESNAEDISEEETDITNEERETNQLICKIFSSILGKAAEGRNNIILQFSNQEAIKDKLDKIVKYLELTGFIIVPDTVVGDNRFITVTW